MIQVTGQVQIFYSNCWQNYVLSYFLKTIFLEIFPQNFQRSALKSDTKIKTSYYADQGRVSKNFAHLGQNKLLSEIDYDKAIILGPVL